MARHAHRLDPVAVVNPLDSVLGYWLRMASNAMMMSLARDLAEIGLSVVEASVLLVVGANPGITQSEIGRLLDIHRANMVPLAAKLAEARLTVARTGAGRAKALTLSARGEKIASAARRIVARSEGAFAVGLGPDRRMQLLRWLRTVWAKRPESKTDGQA
jgi:DNA-binding MarR family transcriptional regulator